MTTSETETATYALDDLVGLHEVIDLIGVASSTFWRWRRAGQRLALPVPEPVLTLACGPIWLRHDIERWNVERIALGMTDPSGR